MHGRPCKSLSPIYFSSCKLDAHLFLLIIWFVISRYHGNLGSTIHRQNGSAISDICYINHLIDYKDYVCTRARSLGPDAWSTVHHMTVMHLLLSLKISFNHRNESIFAFTETLNQGFFWVFREVFTLDNKVVQIVSQILSTYVSTVSVKNSKETHLWPISFPLLIFRFKNVQDNRDSVFIILTNNTLVSICSISFNNAAFLIWSFGNLMIFELEGSWIKGNRVFSEEQSLYINECNIRRAVLISSTTASLCRFMRTWGRATTSRRYWEAATHCRSCWVLEKGRTTSTLNGVFSSLTMASHSHIFSWSPWGDPSVSERWDSISLIKILGATKEVIRHDRSCWLVRLIHLIIQTLLIIKV